MGLATAHQPEDDKGTDTGSKPGQLVVGERAELGVTHPEAKEVQQEPLDPIPGNPHPEQLPVAEGEAAIDVIEGANENDRPQHVVHGHVVINPAQTV